MSKLRYNKLFQIQQVQVVYSVQKNGYAFMVIFDKGLSRVKIRDPFCIEATRERFFDGSGSAVKALLSVVNLIHAMFPVVYFDMSVYFDGQFFVEYDHVIQSLKNINYEED